MMVKLEPLPKRVWCESCGCEMDCRCCSYRERCRAYKESKKARKKSKRSKGISHEQYDYE